MQTIAPPAAMTSAYRPLAEDLLLLDAAKKDSTAPSNTRSPVACSTDFKHRSIGRTTAKEANEARHQAMRNLLYRKDS